MLAVAAATVAAFLISSVWYAVFGGMLGGSDEATPPWKIAVELLRCLTLALVSPALVSQADDRRRSPTVSCSASSCGSASRSSCGSAR